MSVAIAFRVETRPWRGYDDPGLPTGLWLGQGTQVGDGTGGVNQIDLVFKLSGQALDGRVWSLDQLSVASGVSADVSGTLITQNMDFLSPSRALASVQWTFTLLNGVTNGDAQTPLNALTKPIILGAANSVGLGAALRCQVDNADPGALTVTAGGYIWGPRSVLAEGGLRRPAQGMFGA